MLKIADNRPNVLANCLQEVVKLHQAGKLQPQVGGTYTIDKVAEAHAALENGKTTGKLTVFWD